MVQGEGGQLRELLAYDPEAELEYSPKLIHTNYVNGPRRRELFLPNSEKQYSSHLKGSEERVTCDHVNRQCEGGCFRKLKFAPLKGWKVLLDCKECGRKTWWRVVE